MMELLGLGSRVLLTNLREPRMPYRMTFIATERCQLRCSMCNIWKREAGDELAVEEVAEFFRKSCGFSWVNISGGEVFLRDDFADMVRAISRTCRGLYLLNFPTNGFMTERIVEFTHEILMTCRIPRVIMTVSMDGPADVHDRVRGVQGSWDRAAETFRALRKLRSRGGFEVYFGTTLHGANLGSFDLMLGELTKKIGPLSPRDFHINIAQKSPHYYGNEDFDTGIPPQKLIEAMIDLTSRRRMRGLVDYLERRYQYLAQRYLHTGLSPVPCEALSSNLFLGPDGSVYPCVTFNEKIGTIRDHDFDLKKIWYLRKRLDLRADIRAGRCPGCWTPCEAYQSLLGNLARQALL